MGLKHNKKRNSALVYELLVRNMSDAVLAQDQKRYVDTLRIIKKFFSEGTCIATERELSDMIVENRGATREFAEKFLRQIYEHARKINATALTKEKDGLIREINHSLGQDIFSKFHVPNYRLLASIQLAIEGSRMTLERISENVQRIQVEESLIKFMMSPRIDESKKGQEGAEVDGLVCSLAARKFQEAYGSGNLFANQRRLLDSYLRSLMDGNQEKLKERITKDVSEISRVLKENAGLDEIVSDKIMVEKYQQAVGDLERLDLNNVTTELVEKVMLYHGLCGELKQ